MINREAEAVAMAARIKERMFALMDGQPATRATLIAAAIAAARDVPPARGVRIERADDNRLDVLIELPSDFAAMNGITAADLAAGPVYEISFKVKP